MKMSPEIFEAMKADILSVAKALQIDIKSADGGSTGLKTMWELLHKVSQDRAFDDSHPAFQSGAWKRVLPCDKRNYCFYYADDCDDSHVETALRKIKDSL